MYLIENTLTGETQVVEVVPEALGEYEVYRGEVPGGMAPHLAKWDGTAIVADLAGPKANLAARVKRRREQAKDAGIVTPWGPLETDPDSRVNINGAVQMATILGADFTITWRMSNNDPVVLDASQMIQMGIMVGQHVSACQYRKNELDAQIAAATTLEELGAIALEDGWPS